MCGRYYIPDEDPDVMLRGLAETMNRRGMAFPKGDIAPGMSAPVRSADGMSLMQWGVRTEDRLIINARSETARDKTMFAYAVRRGRLLLPCGGFYEWKHVRRRCGTKYRCEPRTGGLKWMAALAVSTGEGDRFVVLTRPAANGMCSLHDRMPLFLPEELRDKWLSGSDAAYDEMLNELPPVVELTACGPEQLSLF